MNTNVLHKLKRKLTLIIAFFQRDVETTKSKANVKKTLTISAHILWVVCIIMSFLNYFNHRTLMLYSTLFLAISFCFCSLIIRFFYNEKLIKLLVTISIGGTFSYYTIIGGNNGFALLWTILIPFACIAILDMNYGIFLGIYFWFFITLFFWTPLKNILLYQYSSDTLLRYPIFYLCGLTLSIIIGVKEKRLRIIEIDNDLRLKNAVLAEQRRVERMSVDAISSICHALDAKDSYTGQHSEHVAFYTKQIATKLCMDSDEIDIIVRAAKLHDIGKIGIPDAIINKNSRLTDEEYLQMKQHVIMGAQILSDFTTMPELVVGAKYHHERFDGLGYGEGLTGEDIPLEGRIIAIADSIDAMYSTRSYRTKTTQDFVKEELQKGKGKQFDPALVDIAIQLIEEGMLDTLDIV